MPERQLEMHWRWQEMGAERTAVGERTAKEEVGLLQGEINIAIMMMMMIDTTCTSYMRTS